MNGNHALGCFWLRDLWGRRNHGFFEDDRRTSRGACAPRPSNHQSREVGANSTAQRPATSMEQGGQSHRASEPEWPQRLNEWDRPVHASRLIMLGWRCAEAESRRAEMAGTQAVQPSLPGHFPSSIRPTRVLLSKGTIPTEFKSEGEAAPCGSLGYRSPRRCRVSPAGLPRVKP
jgi:hypothetical protein